MTPKASSDFGLYKEKQNENNLRSIKFVLVVVGSAVFVLVILYALTHLTSDSTHMENSSESSIEKPVIRAEKLRLSETVKREIVQNSNTPPKPFRMTYRGIPPSEFTSTTEKITTLSYPQAHTYRHRYYPNNIQEILGHANKLQRPVENNQVSSVYHKNYEESSSQNQYTPQNKRSVKNFTFVDNDPFYLFKPQGPGDINLLATTHFRFAPPSWTNLKTPIPRVYSPQPEYHGNIKRHEVSSYRKPLKLTFNIFPNKAKERLAEYRRRLKHFINQRIEEFQSRLQFQDNKPKKMVIHLNLYPEDVNGSENGVHIQTLPTPPKT